MARVEIKPHVGVQMTSKGKRSVRFNQDIVLVYETFYSESGDEEEVYYIAGYCNTKPGSPFLPIRHGIPDGIMLDIKRALAERDAAETGASLFDTMKRNVAAPPPQVGDIEDDDSDA